MTAEWHGTQDGQVWGVKARVHPKGECDAEGAQVDGVQTAACEGGFRGIAAQEGEEEEGRAMRRSFLRGLPDPDFGAGDI